MKHSAHAELRGPRRASGGSAGHTRRRGKARKERRRIRGRRRPQNAPCDRYREAETRPGGARGRMSGLERGRGRRSAMHRAEGANRRRTLAGGRPAWRRARATVRQPPPRHGRASVRTRAETKLRPLAAAPRRQSALNLFRVPPGIAAVREAPLFVLPVCASRLSEAQEGQSRTCTSVMTTEAFNRRITTSARLSAGGLVRPCRRAATH